MKKIISVLLIIAALLSFAACGEASEKTFSKDGMSITLTDAFKEADVDGYTVCYDSKNVAVFILKEEFSLLEGAENLKLDEYIELLRQSNSDKNAGEAVTSDGLTYFEYTFLNEEENVTYKYFTTAIKSEDAFWMVQFSAKEDSYDEQKANFITWAKSVSFE